MWCNLARLYRDSLSVAKPVRGAFKISWPYGYVKLLIVKQSQTYFDIGSQNTVKHLIHASRWSVSSIEAVPLHFIQLYMGKRKNCTISILEGNSYCHRKSSARGFRFKVSSEGLRLIYWYGTVTHPSTDQGRCCLTPVHQAEFQSTLTYACMYVSMYVCMYVCM